MNTKLQVRFLHYGNLEQLRPKGNETKRKEKKRKEKKRKEKKENILYSLADTQVLWKEQVPGLFIYDGSAWHRLSD